MTSLSYDYFQSFSAGNTASLGVSLNCDHFWIFEDDVFELDLWAPFHFSKQFIKLYTNLSQGRTQLLPQYLEVEVSNRIIKLRNNPMSSKSFF
jgi:hypothetical protein